MLTFVGAGLEVRLLDLRVAGSMCFRSTASASCALVVLRGLLFAFVDMKSLMIFFLSNMLKQMIDLVK